MKIPRKLKKKLKNLLLSKIDNAWKSMNIKIHAVQKHSRYKYRNPTTGNITLMEYSLS